MFPATEPSLGVLVKHAIAAAAAMACALSPALGYDGSSDRRWAQPYVATRFSSETADANEFQFKNGNGRIQAAGFVLGENLRVEYSVSRQSESIKGVPPIPAHGHFSMRSQMLNVAYHVRSIDKRFSPFIGAGVGYTVSNVAALSTSPDPEHFGLGFVPQRHNAIAFQGVLGISYHVAKHIDIETAASYFTAGDENYRSTFANSPMVEAAYRTYGAQIGLRLRY